MANAFVCDIEGTDYHALRLVKSVSVEAASATRNGTGTVQLVYPYGAGYSFYPTQEVRVYRSVGGASYGLLGGFIESVAYETVKTSNPNNAYTVATLTCVDYNTLLDHVVPDGSQTAILTIAAGTFAAQVADAVQQMQENGNGTVSRAIDTSSRVTNLTGATVLPAFTIQGESLRQVMRRLCATAQEDTPALRPRFGIMLDDDGAAGVMVAMAVWDGAVPPSSMLTFSYTPTGAERGVISIGRVLDGNMPLLNTRQSTYLEEGQVNLFTYENTASEATYFNRYLNTGLTGNKGGWTLPPLDDSNSSNSAEAQALLTQSVDGVAYPRETINVTYDKPVTDATFLSPGRGATLIWPPFGINSPGTLYEVSAVSVSFPKPQDPLYERLTVTLGLPLLELFEDGQTGSARAPIIGKPKLPAPVWDAPYTTGADPRGTWVRGSIAAIPGAQSYNYYYRTISSGNDILITNSTDIAVTLFGQPDSGCTRYLRASAVNADGKEGYRSTLKTVVIPGPFKPQPPPPGWDTYYQDDSDLRGLEVSVGLSTDIAWLATPLYDGKTTLSLGRSTGTVVHTVLGPKINATAGDVITVGVARERSAASGSSTSGLFVKAYNSADSVISTQTIFSAIATTSFVYTEGSVTMPANTVYWRWALVHDNSPGSSSTRSYFSFPQITKTVKSAPAIALDVETNPLKLFDALGNYRGQVVYDSANDVLRYLSANPTSSTGIELGGTNTRIFLDEANNTIQVRHGANVVLHNAGLADPATDGYTYIPTIDTTPSGTPTAFTGTNAITYCESDRRLYVYDNSIGAWRASSLFT